MSSPPHQTAPRLDVGERGLTLVELMVVLAVLGLIIAVGLPNFKGVLNSSRLSSTANEFIGGVQVARAEAIRRATRVTLCRSADGATCTAGTRWPGWIVFVDANADGAVSAGEEVLKVGTIDGSLDVRASPAISGLSDSIRFGANGLAVGSTELALLNARIAVCVASTQPVANVRDVAITSGARSSVQSRSTGGSCSSAPSDN